MQRPRTLVTSLWLAALAGSLALAGCGGGDDDPVIVPAAATSVGAKSFTFASGAVINAGLAGQPTTLAFNSGGSRFSVAAPAGRATGSNTFGSCILAVGSGTNPDAVGGGSSFPPGTGPQPGATITLSTCEVNTDTNTLNATNSNGTSGSAAGGGASTGGFGG